MSDSERDLRSCDRGFIGRIRVCSGLVELEKYRVDFHDIFLFLFFMQINMVFVNFALRMSNAFSTNIINGKVTLTVSHFFSTAEPI